VVTHWSAGDPNHFAPSVDGINPAPVDENGLSHGVCFIRVGSKSQMSNSSNWAQMLEALRDAESQAPHLKREKTPNVQFMIGLYGHWDRIPQKKRSGMIRDQAAEQVGRARDVLVLTQLKARGAQPSAPAAAGPRGVPRPAATTPAAPAAPAASPLDDTLQAIVAKALSAAPDGFPKGKLAALVLKAPELQAAQRAKAVPRITSNEFLDQGMERELWLFDAESGLVAPYPTES